MDDMYKSIKAFLYDRVSSPLFGAFLLSWVLVNFRIILTVFSSEDLDAKFQIIDTLFSVVFFEQQHFWLGFFIHSFLLPAALTISYIYLYPLLAKPVYEHSLRKQKELREIKQSENNVRLLSEEESRQIFIEMANLKGKQSSEINTYRNENSALLERIKELEGLGNQASKAVDFLRKLNIEGKFKQLPDGLFKLSELVGQGEWKNLTDVEKKLLGKEFLTMVKSMQYEGVTYEGKDTSNHAQYLKRAAINGGVKLSELKEKILAIFGKSSDNKLNKLSFSGLDEHSIKIDLALGELVGRLYIDGNNYGEYSLKQKGRKYIVENNLLEE